MTNPNLLLVLDTFPLPTEAPNMTALRFALCQIQPNLGDVMANTQKIIDWVTKAKDSADVFIFPELSLCGYPPEDLLFNTAFINHIEKALAMICALKHPGVLIVGHPIAEHQALYNGLCIIQNGKIIAQYRKQYLPNYGVFDEMRYFSPGQEPVPVVEIMGTRLGICICEDIWHDAPFLQAQNAKAKLLICINASPFSTEKHALRQNLLQRKAAQGMGIIYVNQCLGQDDLLFDGQSMSFNAQGQLVQQAPAFRESLDIVTFEQNQLKGSIAQNNKDTALCYEALVFATKQYLQRNGFQKAVLGLSGGIDSAVTLAIAADALGGQNVHALIMPSRYTQDISLEDAITQAKALGSSYDVVSIEPLVAQYQESLQPILGNIHSGLTAENLQARIRGMLLMAYSNQTGALLLSTSNKSEVAVGYSTLYGDMCGGYVVLKDVLKTDVYALAHYRNNLSAVIPERVIERAPSAELRDDQKDEDSLPPYDVLDAILRARMEQHKSLAELLAMGFDEAIVKHVLSLIKNSEYKRKQAPPGPRISERAFGRDWRYPLSSEFREQV